jgi:predicted phosphate transport protein (TIGR00153 family)
LRNFLFRKQAHIEQGFEQFLGCIQRCSEIFDTAMLSYLEHGSGESFEKSRELVERAESSADEIRKDIERILYKHELLPDSRGDLLNLLELCDHVANRIESVIRGVSMRQVDIPQVLHDRIKLMLVPSQSAVETLMTAVRLLFVEPDKVKLAVDDVERLESECDQIQHATIRAIYQMEIDLAQQIQLERLINDLGTIADRAEDAAHALEIMAIKRKL